MVAGVIFYFWLIIGLIFFFVFDKWQMKKEVPYGNFPSVAPLRTIRIVICIFCMLFWFPIAVYAFVKTVSRDYEE
jgi:hypothetical protein